ncbi:A-kinase anchor protein 12b isoform X2 [Nematolebias whitei]|uniref:A-kinase anchor protein 12b isoform X2 n=1 Tax=Nematolebias whitei TaxID=451745 RepID=UPI00189BFDDC|nr:A-kinase anchor protein 12b isoform X2 [Nematolebias whitei]
MLGTITLTVGQPDGVSVAQKEEASDATETAQVEETPQVNGEKMDKESPDVNEITSIEEKATDEKPNNANEVGFKKIFSIVGLKFTLKKDKSEEADPVKLLIVKDKEGEEVCETKEAAKDKEATEKATTEVKEADTEPSATEADKAEATDPQLEGVAAKAANEEVKEEGAEREAETSSPTKDTGVSSFRKFFSGGLFSNLRKKNSIKKTKDEEETETTVKESNIEEAAAEEKEEKEAPEQETKEVEAKEKETQGEKDVIDEKTKENDVTENEVKEEKSESEPKEDAPSTQQEATSETTPEEKVEASAATDSTTETKQEDQKLEEKVPEEATSEAEHQSSPEKSKPHGSPLKKLFTGAGLKKLSTKRHKNKKESESKPAESGEQAVEQLQSSNESEEAPKADSGPSSPEASGEHVIAVEVNQNESSQEHEGETTSDSEKKKDGVIASFRKLVSPKKYAKRSSDSEDEGTSDKLVKSATLSSSESAPVEEKVEEKETKEDKPSEEEPKTENTEKLTSSTEEPKKKMDTSVSWEALMCMGGPKKRTRKTSDSDDEETKAEEETAGEKAEEKEEDETEGAEVPPQSPENEEVITPAPEPARESPWSTLKRLVMPKNKPKSEEKPEEPADQVQPDTETSKEESSFSLKKLFHGRRKKVEKQTSADQGSGEEDSDTPAVVPLSEYEEQAEAEQEAPAEPASVQAKVSADDRSPSWIPAVVEDDKHDQLSDIPEEVENLATPKSVDTDIADDDTEDQVALPKGPSSTECKLSMAEVKPITLAPAAATSSIPQGPEIQTADEVVSKIEAQVSEVPAQTSVTLEYAPLDVASAETEPEMENAKSVTKAILEPHVQSEVVAICTGLEIKELEDVSLEQPIEPTVECIGPVSGVTSVEIAVEQKAEELEEAAATEDPVHKAQVHLVQTLELEPVVEELVGEDLDIQAASESYEAEIEKVGVVGTENSEVIQPTLLKKNSPNTVMVDPITPIPEMVVCTQTVEVSEVVVETKESNMDMERHAADGENTPAEEVIQAVAQELSTTECDAKEDTKGTEVAVPADVPSVESAVITETVVLVALDDGEAKKETIQDQKTVEASGKMEVIDNEIETQSAEIAEAVIKDAVGKVLEDIPQSEKSTVTIPTPVKAMATTDIATEPVVSTETPVLGFCEKPSQKSPQTLCVAVEVTETVQLEVTENIKEEETPKKSLKMAAEVEVSKETIIEEEVTEIDGKIEQPEEKESKEVKEADEDVKSQLEECKPEEKSDKVLEIHMPTQVVLQSAEMVEELPVEVETVAELDKDGSNTDATSEKPLRQNELSDLPEEPQESASGEAPSQEAETEKTPSEKCAEVMAQVIEVIEEAVKEIEPVSTEVTAAS